MSANEERHHVKTEQHTKKTEMSRMSRCLVKVLPKREPAFLGPFFRLGDRSVKRIAPFVEKGEVAADLGCGWGHYSFELADMVGAEGKIYSIDIDPKVIAAIRKKAEKGIYRTIEAYASSAADLSFIKDGSVDFIFANGLLCSMAGDRQSAVAEMKRILKPTGHAYISLGAAPPWGYVDKAEWDLMLQGFTVDKGGRFMEKWVVVSLK